MRRSIVKIEVMLFAPTIACSEFRRFFALTLLAVLVLLTATACGEPEPPPTTIAVSPLWPQAGKIAFTSNRDGNQEIYVMNADGSGETRITAAPAADGLPSWSPDGCYIAFASDRDGKGDIYVMNADGSGQTRLTDDSAADSGPSWSIGSVP